MIFAGHQPNFMPNLAFFSKMKQADLFIVTTNIQLERREGWQVRNKILKNNKDFWLTVPVHSSNGMMAKEVDICNDDNWKEKHYNTLYQTYRHAKGFKYLSPFEKVYKKEWSRVVDLNIEIIKRFKKILEIKTPLVIDKETNGQRQKRFINLAKKYHASAYLSGKGAHLYLSKDDIADVQAHGIKFLLHEHNLSGYHLSTIHYLLTHGKKWVQDVI